MSNNDVVLSLPRYSNHIDGRHYEAITHASRKHRIYAVTTRSSIIAQNMNSAWAVALDRAERGECEWFSMLHQDVWAEPGWLDKLLEAAEEYSADVIGAVVALKISPHKCSLAHGDIYDPQVFTLDQVKQIAKERGEVFEYPGMYLNTGCFVVNVRRKDLWDGICFKFTSRIDKVGGKRIPRTACEDHTFSKECYDRGLKVMCHAGIRTVHLDGECSGYRWKLS